MAGSVSAEVWLNQRRWDALEESLKAQGSNIERHLQDYLIKLYNETVPFDQWLQIENAITKEELESAQAAEDQKVYGYQTAILDLRNPTRSDGNNLLHLINKYMDIYKAEPDIQFLVVKSKAFITRRYILKPVKSKCHRREKHLFSAMGAFHINCAVISFAQDL